MLIDLRRTAIPDGNVPLRIDAGVRRTIVALPHDRCVNVDVHYHVVAVRGPRRVDPHRPLRQPVLGGRSCSATRATDARASPATPPPAATTRRWRSTSSPRAEASTCATTPTTSIPSRARLARLSGLSGAAARHHGHAEGGGPRLIAQLARAPPRAGSLAAPDRRAAPRPVRAHDEDAARDERRARRRRPRPARGRPAVEGDRRRRHGPARRAGDRARRQLATRCSRCRSPSPAWSSPRSCSRRRPSPPCTAIPALLLLGVLAAARPGLARARSDGLRPGRRIAGPGPGGAVEPRPRRPAAAAGHAARGGRRPRAHRRRAARAPAPPRARRGRS